MPKKGKGKKGKKGKVKKEVVPEIEKLGPEQATFDVKVWLRILFKKSAAYAKLEQSV